MNSGLPVPPPEPAKSSKCGVPSSFVAPKPYGPTGSTNVSEATGWSIAYAAIAAPPVDQPTRCGAARCRARAAARGVVGPVAQSARRVERDALGVPEPAHVRREQPIAAAARRRTGARRSGRSTGCRGSGRPGCRPRARTRRAPAPGGPWRRGVSASRETIRRCRAWSSRRRRRGPRRPGLHDRSAATVLREAFEILGLHRLEANIQPGDQGSLALARRAGFQLEGFSPAYLKIGGEWRDHERWALRAETWRSLQR